MINTIEEAIGRLHYIQLDSYFSPEEIVQMVLAGGATQTLYNVSRGVHYSAVEFLCSGTREIVDYPIPGGIIKENEMGRAFFLEEPGRSSAERRPNEYLGTLAAAGICFEDTPVLTDRGTQLTLVDLARVAMEKYFDSVNEPSWSLMLFSVYPGVRQEWTNDRGEILSVEKILQSACERPYGRDSCLGTHLIQGVAFAVSRFCQDLGREPSQLEGVWRRGFEYVSGAMKLMKRNQREDGSINRSWFRQKWYPGNYLEWKEKIIDIISRRYQPAKAIVYPTGHCLDAISSLSLFLESDKEWIYSACYQVAQTIETRWVELAREIPTLTHAIHALKAFGE